MISPDLVLARVRREKVKLAIGLMSGTSLDGVDAALVEIRGDGLTTRVRLLSHIHRSYPPHLQKRLLGVSEPAGGSTQEVCRLNVLVGEAFAQAALSVCRKAKTAPVSISFVGSHGQTIGHLPEDHATLQIGEPAVIVERTGILTVADFRARDLAAGGCGAPLVPYVDYLLFRHPRISRGLLNLGGIANLTVVPAGAKAEEVQAFDTGPGNMVIDALARHFRLGPFDQGGKKASRGMVSTHLLSVLMQNGFIRRKPPKSTGREAFGKGFVNDLLAKAKKLKLSKEDVLATATALTAHAVFYNYRCILSRRPINELVVSGGGTKNRTLMNWLRVLFAPAPVTTTDAYGIPSQAKEALVFAVLANEALSGHPANLPRVTGARGPRVLGKVVFS
jgi:anhydro-N-acetylmuramic acid kinase